MIGDIVGKILDHRASCSSCALQVRAEATVPGDWCVSTNAGDVHAIVVPAIRVNSTNGMSERGGDLVVFEGVVVGATAAVDAQGVCSHNEGDGGDHRSEAHD